MSDTTILLRSLLAEIETEIKFAEHLANVCAQSLRDNKIDWLIADDDIYARQKEIDAICRPLLTVLVTTGPKEAHAALLETREEAQQRIGQLREVLRRTALFNGPQHPRIKGALDAEHRTNSTGA